jgi:hypothetical protein
MRVLHLCAIGALGAMLVLPRGAQAYCACACVNGKVQNVCSNQFDTEVYCSKYCPPNPLPPGATQKNSDLENFASSSDKTGPQDKLFIGGASR